MVKPAVLVQLTDSHIGAVWSEGDPIVGLRAAIAAIGRLDVTPDAILVSGDLTENGAVAEYELVQESLQGLGVPIHVLPGKPRRQSGAAQVFRSGRGSRRTDPAQR